MNVRILKPDEIDRANVGEGYSMLPYVAPHNAALVVVEDGSDLAARLGVYAVTYFEGLWVAPAYRRNPGVMRSLLRQAVAIPRARGESWALGAATDDEMRGYLDRLGSKLPVDPYVLFVGGASCHKPQ